MSSWVVAVPLDDGSLWVAVSDDGRVEAFPVARNMVKAIAISPNQLPSGMPPLLSLENGNPKLITASEATYLSVNELPDACLLADEKGRLLWKQPLSV